MSATDNKFHTKRHNKSGQSRLTYKQFMFSYFRTYKINLCEQQYTVCIPQGKNNIYECTCIIFGYITQKERKPAFNLQRLNLSDLGAVLEIVEFYA